MLVLFLLIKCFLGTKPRRKHMLHRTSMIQQFKEKKHHKSSRSPSSIFLSFFQKKLNSFGRNPVILMH